MLSKQLIVDRATSAPFISGVFAAPNRAYQFGAVFHIRSGAPAATLVFERTADGGVTWLPVVTFTLNTEGEIATPADANLAFDGTVVRARITSITGGNAEISAWIR